MSRAALAGIAEAGQELADRCDGFLPQASPRLLLLLLLSRLRSRRRCGGVRKADLDHSRPIQVPTGLGDGAYSFLSPAGRDREDERRVLSGLLHVGGEVR
jgi:hypothetical protein